MITTGTDTLIDLDEADIYFDARLRSATWKAASDDDKEAALRMASAMLSEERFVGWRTDAEQPLAWPRDAVSRPDADVRADFIAGMITSPAFFPNGSIPPTIRHACAELAFALLREDLTDDRALRASAATSRQVGDLKISYGTVQNDRSHLPAIVQRLIAPFLQPGSRHSARLVP